MNKSDNIKSKQNETNSSQCNDSSDNICVLCFKNVEIYSIGECDHPVCYECSTRMRVLCEQNECPICRQNLAKVIFTYDKLSYRELEAKNRSDYYNKKYKIGFSTNKIQQAFFELLDHPCPKCNHPPFRSFTDLKEHVRKEHDLYYCDLCTENLKIFSFERRCYTQAELGLHRVKGDADNKSHRGHPLCEYCNCRYLDRDELFRHLRRNHYFCHFCDADGCNEFYGDYNALADHFRTGHFLCEEGKCATEQFTGAFRTEIDYKAHVASVHGKALNKQQAKQARTLQLEITLGPRGRSGQPESGYAHVRSRGNDEPPDDCLDNFPQSFPTTIDAHNEQDFPSLAGATNSSVSLMRPLSMKNKSGTANLARTKENFPALGGGLCTSQSNRTAQQTPISSVVKKSGQTSRTNNTNGGSGMVIHVSNRPSSLPSTSKQEVTVKGKVISAKHDFPALPTSSKQKITRDDSYSLPSSTTQMTVRPGLVSNSLPAKQLSSGKSDFPALSSTSSKSKNLSDLEEDMVPSSSNFNVGNISAKHRALVDDYVSVANPVVFQKIQMVKKDDTELKTKLSMERHAPKLTTQDFPALGAGVNEGNANKNTFQPSPTNSWSKFDKKQRENENRKSKISSPPIVCNSVKEKTTPKQLSSLQQNDDTNNGRDTNLTKKDKKQSKNQQKKLESTNGAKTLSNKSKEKNYNENKQIITSDNISTNGNAEAKASLSVDSFPTLCNPPPGFPASKSSSAHVLKPPPGFQKVTLNSVAKSPNDFTFTSSLGESYNIISTYSYIPPHESVARNHKLVSHFKEALKSTDALEQFRQISQRLREGYYKALPYYEHCQAALKDKFEVIFPELLTLLPDISLQQSLYLVHSQRLNTLTADERRLLPKLEVCSACKQVMLQSDVENHIKVHVLKDNFPLLQHGSSAGGENNSRSLKTNRK